MSGHDSFLADHAITAILQDAVAHVLRTRPVDPIVAISDYCLAAGKTAKVRGSAAWVGMKQTTSAELPLPIKCSVCSFFYFAAASACPRCAAPAPKSTNAAAATQLSTTVKAHGRERVKDLVAKHAHAIMTLRALVSAEPHFDPRLHDDLFLLRFVLSHEKKGGIAAAAAAAKGTIAFRFARGLDDPSVPVGGQAALKVVAVAKLYAALRDPAGISYYVPDPDRATVLVAVPALLDFHKMVATLSDEEQTLAHGYSTEWLWRQADAVTRRTGYLTKYVRLVDLNGMSLRNFSRDFQRRDAKNAKAIEEFYPQLLGAVFICHAPRWLQGVWRGIKRLMPARVVEKVDFLEPLTNSAERNKLLAWIALEHLPTCFGGPCEVWPPPNSRFT